MECPHQDSNLGPADYELALGGCAPTPREETGFQGEQRRLARKHPGTQTDLPMVLASPLMSVVDGMVRQPHW